MIFVSPNFSSYQRYRTENAPDFLQAIPAMPSSKSKRFDLGSFMKTRKEMRQKVVEESRAMKTELNTINRQINRLKSKVCVL